MKKYYSYTVITLLAVVFFASGTGKLLEPTGAVNALVMAFGISYTASKLLVFLLSNGEIALAVLALTKRFRAIAMKAMAATLAMFLIFLVYVKTNGIIMDDCGCFGGLLKRMIPEAIMDEIILVVFCIGYFIIQKRNADTANSMFTKKLSQIS